jgi:hypothetical protein
MNLFIDNLDSDFQFATFYSLKMRFKKGVFLPVNNSAIRDIFAF